MGLKMYNKNAFFKFVPREIGEIASKDFHLQKQETDIFTINENRFVVSNKVSCNNGNRWRYVLCSHEDGGTIIPLLYKKKKAYLTMAHLNATITFKCFKQKSFKWYLCMQGR